MKGGVLLDRWWKRSACALAQLRGVEVRLYIVERGPLERPGSAEVRATP